jgi:Zn-dependent protease
MFSSLKLGSPFGIGLYLHWTFFLLPAWVLLNLGPVSLGYAVFSLVLVLAVFGCVVLHELGHALTARRFGIATRDITLYPIGGVASLERMSEKPWEEFWIALAGPAVNALIAALLWAFLIVSGPIGHLVPLPGLGLAFLESVLWINVILMGFNLLPAFPMDGGRVLRALLALRLGHLRATEVAVQIGLAVAMLMGFAGVFYFHNLSLMLVAAFVFFAAQQELAAARRRAMDRGDSQPFSFWRNEHFDHPSPPPANRAPVYLWDSKNGLWVEQKPLRPARGYWQEVE